MWCLSHACFTATKTPLKAPHTLIAPLFIPRRHAGEGGSYHFFVGKDASRAFVTGDFQHDLNDRVEDLQPDQLASIDGWRSFYAKVRLGGVPACLICILGGVYAHVA